jgi:hypothetical protein
MEKVGKEEYFGYVPRKTRRRTSAKTEVKSACQMKYIGKTSKTVPPQRPPLLRKYCREQFSQNSGKKVLPFPGIFLRKSEPFSRVFSYLLKTKGQLSRIIQFCSYAAKHS